MFFCKIKIHVLIPFFVAITLFYYILHQHREQKVSFLTTIKSSNSDKWLLYIITLRLPSPSTQESSSS